VLLVISNIAYTLNETPFTPYLGPYHQAQAAPGIGIEAIETTGHFFVSSFYLSD